MMFNIIALGAIVAITATLATVFGLSLLKAQSTGQDTELWEIDND